MQKYIFIGGEPRFYSRWEGRTFTASNGDVMEFENPPTDGQWVLAASAVAPVENDEWYKTPAQESTK